jgi:hypothetical protein
MYGGKSVLREFENTVPSRMFGPNRERDTGYWWENEKERDH